LVAAVHEERDQGQLQEVDEVEASQDVQTSRSEEQLLAASDPGEHTEPRKRLALMLLFSLI
jgi:hypothetical protein